MEHRDIEIRSEEVQEVMGQIPPWILRWGITLLFLVILVLVVGSCFFRYPDVIVTEMVLTGREPAAQIVARASGRITRMQVEDGESVAPGKVLAVIQNPASTEDVLLLKEKLALYSLHPEHILSSSLPERSNGTGLGEIQSSYTTFLNSLYEYSNHKELDYYPKKMAFTRAQINKYQTYYRNMERQQRVTQMQHTIAAQQHERDSLLYKRGVLSPSEYETSRTTYLQSQYALEGADASLENLKIQIGQLEESLLDLELQLLEKENLLLQNYRTSSEQLLNAIHSWELSYCLTSPIQGKVTFTTYWNENQFIQMGETVFTVVPEENGQLIGKASLPVERSGKVKVGQRVIVRFRNYPDQEFGVVSGKVSVISLVPMANKYMVEILFPEGLTTNYGITLPLSHEMTAYAEIVTEELRLIERFIQPIRKVFLNN